MKWKIVGYDSTEVVFERQIPDALTEAEVTTLLQRLASRHLEDDEVISSSLRKNSAQYLPHLEIKKNVGGKKQMLMTIGSGAYYTATFE